MWEYILMHHFSTSLSDTADKNSDYVTVLLLRQGDICGLIVYNGLLTL